MNLSKSYQDLISCCNHRIMVLDGDFGTELQRQNVTEAEFRGKMFADHFVNLKGDNEVLCLTAPDKVKDVHQAYLAAGADLIRTNTFGATSFGQAKYRLQHMAYDIAKAGAQVAREALKEHNDRIRIMGNLVKPKFVVGSVGPIGKTAGISPRETGRTVTFGDLVNAYGEQIRGLLDGGADALLVESVSDTLDCKAALYAICKECEKRGELFPIMVSVSITGEGGRTQSGQTARALWHSLSSFPIFSIGFSSSSETKDVFLHLRDVSDAYVRVSAFVDGNVPDEFQVNIVGGCSGTSPETVHSLTRMVAHRDPRKVPSRKYNLLLSGLDAMEIRSENRFVSIAPPERGGQVIQVNLDGGLADPRTEMPRFLKNMLSDRIMARNPVMIESDRWNVLLAGMESAQGKGIVNSISLKDGEEAFLARAEEIRRHGFAVVCKAADAKGLALTYERRVEMFENMYRLLVGRLDFLPEDILFDPNVCPIGTGRDEHPEASREFFESCRYVKEMLPHAHVVGNLSLLSYAFKEDTRLRDSMQAVFLYHAGMAGMDFGIVDTGTLPAYEEIPLELRHLIEDLMFNRSADATDRLLEYAEAACKGKTGSEGKKVFLPRLEKRFAELKENLSARRQALESEGKARPVGAAKFLLASLDSVVHDIDRDILAELLSCYGFPVSDLGYGVSCEKILESIICDPPDLVYLSAQFATGLSEMVRVAREFKRREIGTVLVIGGEAASDKFAAIRIAPEALGPVVYVSDVRKVAKVVEALVDDSRRPAFFAALKSHQDRLRLS
ncbi:MAG: homocysteine S-methyltransferase family protein [Fibrobacter sp.]|nr:homocysteine S-methyltransferase family protein [Fibrobacter sp.]